MGAPVNTLVQSPSLRSNYDLPGWFKAASSRPVRGSAPG
ncbi:hypothetical protein SGLAM104S_02919 [Streptomyces glaucescens]